MKTFLAITTLALMLPGVSATQKKTVVQGVWPKDIARKLKTRAPQRTSPSQGSAKTTSHASTLNVRSWDPDYHYSDDGLHVKTIPHEEYERSLQPLREAQRLRAEEEGRILALVDAGRVTEARARLDRQMRSDPQFILERPFAVDVFFAQGDYDAAYRVLAPYADQPVGQALLARLSLAAAGRGEIYSGQLAYCNRATMTYFNGQTGVAESLPAREAVDAVYVSSCVALGTTAQFTLDRQRERLFFSLVRRRDPNNPSACYGLASLAVGEGRYADAKALFAKAEGRATGGFKQIASHGREQAEARLKQIEWRKAHGMPASSDVD